MFGNSFLLHTRARLGYFVINELLVVLNHPVTTKTHPFSSTGEYFCLFSLFNEKGLLSVGQRTPCPASKTDQTKIERDKRKQVQKSRQDSSGQKHLLDIMRLSFKDSQRQRSTYGSCQGHRVGGKCQTVF